MSVCVCAEHRCVLKCCVCLLMLPRGWVMQQPAGTTSAAAQLATCVCFRALRHFLPCEPRISTHANASCQHRPTPGSVGAEH